MMPQDAARITEANLLDLSNVDQASCTGTLSFFSGEDDSTVRIDLRTGQLLAVPRMPVSAATPIPEPSANSNDKLPSPGGRYVLTYTEEPSPAVTLENTKGGKLATITETDAPGMTDVVWGPTDEYFAYIDSDGYTGDLFAYSVADRRSKLVERGVQGEPQWASDGSLLMCRKQSKASKKLSRGQYSWGTIVVLDARNRLKTILKTGTLAGKCRISPRCDRIAYIELVKDEYGDTSSLALRVRDIRIGGVKELLVNRREPLFIWAGNDALAATTYDRFAVPTLSIMGIDGKLTKLVTTKGYATIEPLAYLERSGRLVYKCSTSIDSEMGHEELWAVGPGKHPVCLFPKQKTRAAR